jgi:hypothetical protein
MGGWPSLILQDSQNGGCPIPSMRFACSGQALPAIVREGGATAHGEIAKGLASPPTAIKTPATIRSI